MRWSKYIAFSILAMLIFEIVSLDCAPAKEKPPIKIGVVYDLSGPEGGLGAAMLPAMKMAFEEKKMEVAGRKIELLVEDGASSAEVSLTKAKKLGTLDKVHLLLLGPNPVVGYAVRDYVHQARIPTLAITAGAAHSRKLFSPYFFRVQPSTYQHSYETAKWWYKYGFKKFIYVAVDFVATHEIIEAVKKGLGEMGGEIIQEVWAPITTTDWGPYLPKLKLAEADAVMAVVYGMTGVRFVKQWAEYGLKGKIPVIGDGSSLDEGVSLPAMGVDADGYFAMAGSCPSTDIPENKKFVESYKGRTGGKLPCILSYLACTSAAFAYQAMDKIHGDVEDADKLVKSLEKVELVAPMGSKVYFDKKHAMPIDYVFMKVKRTNGECHTFEIGRITVKEPYDLFP